jgi:aminobenzoyl-glutamate transport protein
VTLQENGMTTLKNTTTEPGLSPMMNRLFRLLSAVERLGNRLPQPFWLFWILAGVLAITSLILDIADVAVTSPESGEKVAVTNLLSYDGLTFAFDSALDNFAGFPALPVVVTVLMGVTVAERSGLMRAILRVTLVKLSPRWVTFSVAFAGMVSHVTFDAAFVILIPLAALAFKAVGRSPALGVAVAFVSISAGYNASPLVTPSDAILASLTTSAAHIVDPSYVVTPLASYYWNAASAVLLSIVITVMIELVLVKRGNLAADPDADEDDDVSLALTPAERRGLLRAGVVAILYIGAVVALLLPSSSPLRGKDGSLLQSVVLLNVAVFIAMLFVLIGLVYGRTAGTIESTGSIPGLMADGIRLIAPVIVLFFAISQFLAYFKWTGVGTVTAVRGAELLKSMDTNHLAILIALVLVVSVTNLLVTSGSAMWALISPVVVPMLMYVDVSPEVAQTVFRIGDSCTNAVTPMSAYFVLALGYMQRYRRTAGIGTLVSFTLPIAMVMLLVWIAFFAAWYALGVPLGPGVPVR